MLGILIQNIYLSYNKQFTYHKDLIILHIDDIKFVSRMVSQRYHGVKTCKDVSKYFGNMCVVYRHMASRVHSISTRIRETQYYYHVNYLTFRKKLYIYNFEVRIYFFLVYGDHCCPDFMSFQMLWPSAKTNCDRSSLFYKIL